MTANAFPEELLACRERLLHEGLDPCRAGSISTREEDSDVWWFLAMHGDQVLNGRVLVEHRGSDSVHARSVVEDGRSHQAIYSAFPAIQAVAHFHSAAAVAWSQSGRDLPCFGTTQCHEFHGLIPCARQERGLGQGASMVEAILRREWDPARHPGLLACGDGPWVWGSGVEDLVRRAKTLEFSARAALDTLTLNPNATPISPHDS